MGATPAPIRTEAGDPATKLFMLLFILQFVKVTLVLFCFIIAVINIFICFVIVTIDSFFTIISLFYIPYENMETNFKIFSISVHV